MRNSEYRLHRASLSIGDVGDVGLMRFVPGGMPGGVR
jgi:hypothetical protein